jgi:Mrp family chromosome partitioning ATPase
MSTFAEIRPETATEAAAQKQHSVAIHLATPDPAKTRPDAIHLSQIEMLVQQLFFRHGAAHVRHVGFCSVETSSAVSALCFDVASSLASQGNYDVALVDATLNMTALHTELGLTSPGQGESSWPIAPHLWLVDRGHWLPGGNKNITFDCALRLREVLSEFDFSVLRCGVASTLNSTMAKACDGIALVLAANKTRRLVATQIKEQLTQAHIPLLGSILADRRFPVPLGLYRNL